MPVTATAQRKLWVMVQWNSGLARPALTTSESKLGEKCMIRQKNAMRGLQS